MKITPFLHSEKWTNVLSPVHQCEDFDGQQENCYPIDFVTNSHSPLCVYLGVVIEGTLPRP